VQQGVHGALTWISTIQKQAREAAEKLADRCRAWSLLNKKTLPINKAK